MSICQPWLRMDPRLLGFVGPHDPSLARQRRSDSVGSAVRVRCRPGLDRRRDADRGLDRRPSLARTGSANALDLAGLTLALPALAYTGFLMTETVFYPLLALAAWTMANTIVEPTPRRQALLVGLVALAALTRLQAIVLVAAFPTAVLLSRSSLRRY